MRWRERPSEAVSEAVLEEGLGAFEGAKLPKQSLRHCSRRCEGLGAFEGAKRQFRTAIKTECGQGTR